MKRTLMIVSIYVIIATLYTGLTMLFVTPKTNVYWIGLGVFWAIALIIVLSLSLFSKQKQKLMAFQIPIDTSLNLYLVVVLLVNVLFLIAFPEKTKSFIITHSVIFLLYCLLLSLLVGAKEIIKKQNDNVDNKTCSWKLLTQEFANVKCNLVGLSDVLIAKITTVLDDLLETMKYSSYGLDLDLSADNNKLHQLADDLEKEIDNIVEIRGDNVDRVIQLISKAKILVKQREEKIKILQSNI